MALIYDKNKIYHRKDVNQGILEFEAVNKEKRFKKFIVIEANGKIHHHNHNK